ncbi:MAG: AHH domain-containing protein, partial [Thermosynechococcaceae cyanobacterium]
AKSAVTGVKNLADKAVDAGGKLTHEISEYAKVNPGKTASIVGHGALDVLGFIPVIGALADVVNSGWYAAEGKYDMAAMSMLSAIPGVGDVLGPAAKIASKGSKVLPTVAKLAPTLEKGAKALNSPMGKLLTAGVPIAGTAGLAGTQALTGHGDESLQTLTNLGAPVLGQFGGKYLGAVAKGTDHRVTKAFYNFGGKALSTTGRFTPAAMQTKNVHDTYQQYRGGEAGIEDLMQSGADLTSMTAGTKLASRMDRSLSGKPRIDVPVTHAPGLEPGDVHISYGKGTPKVNHGGNVDPGVLQIHVDKAQEMGLERSPLRRLRDKILRRKPEFQEGTKGYEFNHEASKHQAMADLAFAKAEEHRSKGDHTRADRLEQQAHDLLRSAYDYQSLAQDPTFINELGDGVVAAKKPIYSNHNQIKGLHGKTFDPHTTKLPPGYEVIDLEHGRKLIAVTDPRTNAFNIKQEGIIRVKENGKMNLNNDNRMSYDWNEIYRKDPRARQDVLSAGFSKTGYTIHHVIPDKVTSQHPLTVTAMKLYGFTVDTYENYAPLPMKAKFIELGGAEVGHWAGHSRFDRKVNRSLTVIQKSLELKYSSPIYNWSSHPQKDQITNDLRMRILRLQSVLKSKIRDGKVPMSYSKIPDNYETDFDKNGRIY